MSYDTAISKRLVKTEDSYSDTETMFRSSSSTVKLDSRMCHPIHGRGRVNIVVSTRQLDSAVIEAALCSSCILVATCRVLVRHETRAWS